MCIRDRLCLDACIQTINPHSEKFLCFELKSRPRLCIAVTSLALGMICLAVKADLMKTMSRQCPWVVAVLPLTVYPLLCICWLSTVCASYARHLCTVRNLRTRLNFMGRTPGFGDGREMVQCLFVWLPWSIAALCTPVLLAVRGDGALRSFSVSQICLVNLLPFVGVALFLMCLAYERVAYADTYRPDDGRVRVAWGEGLFILNKSLLGKVLVCAWYALASILLALLVDGIVPRTLGYSHLAFIPIWLVVLAALVVLANSVIQGAFDACQRDGARGACLRCVLRGVLSGSLWTVGAVWVIYCVDALRAKASGVAHGQLGLETIGVDLSMTYLTIVALPVGAVIIVGGREWANW
eukprot:TRINITY_DN19364_c0_g1_i1.p1 TRINITY_DN19364_c0_g1~~TRINITY_DN19364_c0_g1_i1.p1  ORF type:complete len:353 (+),score=38.09 TRINITY_DN19364_c0_g1_i1:139-1197(+)